MKAGNGTGDTWSGTPGAWIFATASLLIMLRVARAAPDDIGAGFILMFGLLAWVIGVALTVVGLVRGHPRSVRGLTLSLGPAALCLGTLIVLVVA